MSEIRLDWDKFVTQMHVLGLGFDEGGKLVLKIPEELASNTKLVTRITRLYRLANTMLSDYHECLGSDTDNSIRLTEPLLLADGAASRAFQAIIAGAE